MLELMISKPTTPVMMQTDTTKRQALPSESGFAQLLQSSLPQPQAATLNDANGKAVNLIDSDAPVLMNVNGFDKVSSEPDALSSSGLASMPIAENMELTLAQFVQVDEKNLSNLNMPASMVQELQVGEQIAEEIASNINMSIFITQDVQLDQKLPSDLLATKLETAAEIAAVGEADVSIHTPSSLSQFENVTPLMDTALEESFVTIESNSTIEQSTPTDLSLPIINGNLTLEAESTIASEEVGLSLVPDVIAEPEGVVPPMSSDVARDETLAEAEQLSAMTADEELVLAQAAIAPDEVNEKGLISQGSEKVVDRTTELRQEARTIKLNTANEQAAQNPMMQKNSTSEDSGQQSRGQSTQQQFTNMAQTVSQNTQTVREQQVERQFNAVLNERLATQTSSTAENARANSPLSSAEGRGQLPVGLQSIGLPVMHQKWGQALGQRVVYMANQQMQQAQITLNPEKLGPVQVRLQIDRDQKVNVVMTAQHGVTREAMEAAMPRLREMLEQSGIDVGSVDVNDQKQFADSEQENSENQQASSANGEVVDENRADSTSDVLTHTTDNVVDYYA
ncbi:MAG: flagellar hook-length control protein FliK [Thiotrichales bacterium]|nr:flagellar hook-length control protein FliK [Thiotrichales bacterium]